MRRLTPGLIVFVVLGLAACGAGNQSAIEGKLLDLEGKPVAGMRITASQAQPLKGYEELESVSKSDGTFRITGLFPSSQYTLKPWVGEGYTQTTVRIVSAPQGATAVVPDPILIVPAFCNKRSVPASNPDSAYIDHGNGTVTDTRTGLMWKQCAEGLSDPACRTGRALHFDWADAPAHAEASTFANYTDWRLPSKDELLSLVEECGINPSINTNRFPNTPISYFWSGSPRTGSSDGALYVLFSSGSVGSGNVRTMRNHVRLVRGGQ